MAVLDELEKAKLQELGVFEEPSVKRSLDESIIDAVISGAPSVLGMLGGGSANYNLINMEAGKQYLKNRAAQEAQPMVKLAGPDGLPYLEKARFALGKQPYEATKAAAAKTPGSEKGRFQTIQYYDPTTKKYGTRVFDTALGKTVSDEAAIARPAAPKSMQYGTLEGGTAINKFIPYENAPTRMVTEPGVGDEQLGRTSSNRLSAESAKSALGSAQKSKEKTLKFIEARSHAEQALADLSDRNITAEQLGSAQMRIAKAINKERLSDDDFKRILGGEYKSYADDINAFLSGKLAASGTPRLIESLKKMSRNLINESNKMIGTVQEMYVPSGLRPKEGQEVLEKAGGINRSFEDKKKRLKGIK